jgi:lipopolysaccharide/colanic/teichoic acid biosynthesis glycosyltransferase
MFGMLMVGLNAAFGLYRRDGPLPFGEYVLRQAAALVIGLPIAYVSSQMLPGGVVFQQAFVPVVLIGLGGLLALRQIMVSPVARMLSPYRVLVLGTGPEALAVEASLEVANPPGLALAGFYPLENVPVRSIAASRIVSKHLTLEETVKHLGIDEIIVAGFVKRAFDIIATVVLLLIALPIMLVIAFLISLDGGTPIIYRQERVGCRGQKFTLLKFRSMTKDAEKDGQPSWASINDSRVTAVGRFMRRTRIDELPQLINVLRGEMSFVGPRPERPQFVATLTEKIPFYGVRHSVKPGLTGWAQVRYTYGGNVEESVKKLEYDLYYVKNHSLLLDLLILLKTVRVVLLGEGAR